MFIKRMALLMLALSFAKNSSAQDLDIMAKTEGGFVYIRNKEAMGYGGCLASINGSYFLQYQEFPSNGILKMSAFDFTKSNSERFNPITHKVSSVSISCNGRFANVEFQ